MPKNKISIIHYMPVEFYPPTMNFINYLSCQPDMVVKIHTTHNFLQRDEFKEKNGVSIFRSFHPKINDSHIVKILKYLQFNLLSFFKLLISKPDILIYYESLSALPSYLYLKFNRKKTKLIIINHEYFSKEWYIKTATKLMKFNHYLERKKLFKCAKLISQTNIDRKIKFLSDHNIPEEKVFLMPNYPPSSFKLTNTTKPVIKSPLRLVYIGTLSLEYSYIKEVCEWVIKNKTDILLDIFAYNIEPITKKYLNELDCQQIQVFEDGINYFKIPHILGNYDVGLVLYNALTDNFKFNAPNKLFEYFGCGLDVWFSSDLITSKNYIITESYPKIIEVDFNRIDEIKWKELVDRENLKRNNSKFYCEVVYKEVLENINITR